MIRASTLELTGRRVLLRPLVEHDFAQWQEVRRRCRSWLVPWEPRPPMGSSDAVEDRRAFAARCGGRERERQLGSGYGFGIFVEGRLGGEINLSSIQRGPFQNAYVGYWIDQALAGRGYAPEALVVARLPEPDRGTGRIDDEAHRAHVADLHRRHDDLGPGGRLLAALGLPVPGGKDLRVRTG